MKNFVFNFNLCLIVNVINATIHFYNNDMFVVASFCLGKEGNKR